MDKRQATTDEVIVIGAGASGLAAAQALHARHIPVRIVDQAQRAGEAWYHRHPRLHLNTHRALSGLPGRALPKSAGAFPSRNSIIRYLDAYARELGVPIDYGVHVLRIDPVGEYWSLKTNDSAYRTRDVVIATGHDRVPHLPAWPGRDRFAGELLHAADFGDAARYRRRKVLVVGAGNSGADILNHLAAINTDRIWISVRHGPVVFPKRLLGLPVQRLSPLMARLPVAVVNRLLGLTERLAFGKLDQWGLRKHPLGAATRLVEHGVSPAIDDGFIAALKAGRSTVVSAIERFETDGVQLTDGGFIKPDVVIAATGYRTGLESMLAHLGVLDAHGVPLANGAQALASHAGLWFTGMRPMLPGFFYMAGRTARDIAAAIAERRNAALAGYADHVLAWSESGD